MSNKNTSGPGQIPAFARPATAVPFDETCSTFGKLQGVSDSTQYPSTLSYKERITMKKNNPYEYNRLYARPATAPECDERLHNDSFVRQSVPRRQHHYSQYGKGVSYDNPSGYVINNKKGALIQSDIPCIEPPVRHTVSDDPQPKDLHDITLRSYKRNFQQDFLGAIRPAAKTTNETYRMFGTYPDDKEFADRLKVPIPNGIISWPAHKKE